MGKRFGRQCPNGCPCEQGQWIMETESVRWLFVEDMNNQGHIENTELIEEEINNINEVRCSICDGALPSREWEALPVVEYMGEARIDLVLVVPRDDEHMSAKISAALSHLREQVSMMGHGHKLIVLGDS